jgi:basic membrane protein A
VRKAGLALILSTLLVLPLISSSADASTSTIVGIAYDTGGPGDHSFNDAVATGIATAKKTLHAQVIQTVTIGSDENRQLRLEYLISKGAHYVLAVGGGYASALRRVAADHPKLQFGIINDASIEMLNVSSLIFNEKQSGYLAGTLAALTSKTRKIGLIGNPIQNKDYEYGFSTGAKATKRSVFVDVKHANGSFAGVTKQMISKGVDVIFVTAVGSDADILSAVTDANKTGSKVSVIGVEPDQYASLALSAKGYVIASLVKRVDRAVVDFISHAQTGDPLSDILDSTKGTYGRRYGVAGGGIELSLWTPSSISLQKSVTAAAKRIQNNSWYLR